MSESKRNPWLYVSFLPITFAIIGLIISTIAHVQNWGADKNGAMIVTVFFCEITFVVSMLGLLAYMRQPEKTPLVKNMRWLNAALVLSTLLISVYLFLG